MTDTLSRAYAADLEVRSEGDGRTIAGIIVPFGRSAVVSDGGPRYLEAFDRGAFTKTIRERGDRVKLLAQHNARQFPLGRATLLREDAAGVYGEFRVSQTAAGDEALALARDGAVDSFSVGFAPVKHIKRDKVTVRTEVALREVSLVTFPAYEDARVESVRSLWDGLDEEQRAELISMFGAATDLAATQERDGADEPGALSTSTEAADADEPVTFDHSARQAQMKLRLAMSQRKGVL